MLVKVIRIFRGIQHDGIDTLVRGELEFLKQAGVDVFVGRISIDVQKLYDWKICRASVALEDLLADLQQHVSTSSTEADEHSGLDAFLCNLPRFLDFVIQKAVCHKFNPFFGANERLTLCASAHS